MYFSCGINYVHVAATSLPFNLHPLKRLKLDEMTSNQLKLHCFIIDLQRLLQISFLHESLLILKSDAMIVVNSE